MNGQLYLHIPACDELWYRQKIMQETGRTPFPESQWPDWYAYFTGQTPQRFYAYIVRKKNGAFIGEVNIHKNEEHPWYEMGIVLEAKYRGQGYASEALALLLQQAFETLEAEAVHNEFEIHREAAVQMYLSAGFTEYRREQQILELLITREQYFRQKAIRKVTSEIAGILAENQPSVYIYGSSVLDDFRLGWSDIDLLVLTQKQITPTQAQRLVHLRQTLLGDEPDNLYYRSFEGGMLTQSAFCSGTADRVVYWGTSGQRITDSYVFDSFCMSELLDKGLLLCGEDIRSQLKAPGYKDLYQDIQNHYGIIRKYAQTTGRDFYSYGWLLDIARGIYTLRTGTVTSKTRAAQWVLEHQLCPVPKSLKAALAVRKEPLKYRDDETVFDFAETLGPDIQRFADVLEKELDLYGKDLAVSGIY